jgi:hypothetical protein
MTITLQTSLSGGELPPSLHGMVDLAWYKNCLKTCRNFIVQPYGGIKNRPGTKLIAEQKTSSSRARLIPFSYSTTQNYVLEFGVGYIRFIYDATQLVYDGTPTSWLTATVYAEGDVRRNSGTDYICLVGHTSGTFATDLAADKWYELPLNTAGESIIELPTDYTADELLTLSYTQSADVLTVVHPNHPPMQLSRYSSTSWSFTEQELNYGPFQNINTDRSITVWPSKSAGVITLTASADLFRAKHVGMLFYLEQKDFGESWLPGKVVTLGQVVRSGGNYYRAHAAGTTGQNIPIGTEANWNDGGVDWEYLHNGFGVARIDSLTSAKVANATVLSYMPQGITSAGYGAAVNVTSTAAYSDGYAELTKAGHGLTVGSYGVMLIDWSVGGTQVGDDYAVNYRVLSTSTIWIDLPSSFVLIGNVTVTSYKAPITASTPSSYKWAFGAFGDPALGDATYGYGPGYPTAVTYYQQRLCFGGTSQQPDTVWMSKTGSYSDFGTSNPILDDDAVTFTLAGSQVNAIKSLLQLDKLLMLTNGSVWAAGSGQQTDVITPSNVGAKLQSYQGVSDLPPLGIGGSALYAQDKAQVVRDLNYQFANDAYTGQNLTARGSHLVDGYYFTEWCFQQSPANVIWMSRNDGTLVGLTYLREQEVVAWHHHDTDGTFESVCSISEGQEDVLYVTVLRNIDGVDTRFIERFNTRLVTDIVDACFVDCAITYDNTNATATTMTLSGGTDYDNDELITVTASAAAFAYPATTDVGDQIIYTDTDGTVYRVTIVSTSSTTVATGRPDSAIPASLRSATATWSWARNTLAGLDHLEGKIVSVLADGYVQAQQVVTGGAITIDPPAVIATVGLPITADAETLPIVINSSETIRGNLKLVSVLRVLVNETRSVWAGPDEDHLYEAKTRTVADQYAQPNLVTGLVELRLASTWERNGSVLIRHTDPTPIGLLALMPEVHVGGA